MKKSSNIFVNSLRDGMSIEEVLHELAVHGFCPNLLNDDNGRWALVLDGYHGYQNVPTKDNAIDISTCFWVKKKQWKTSIRAAVEYGVKDLKV